MDRPWPAVLKWSNQVFDRLERADITWRDREEIYYDRLRLSLSAHTEAPSQQTAPCPAFNAGMCRSTAETHKDGMTTFSHACAYCEAVAAPGKHNHSAHLCAKRRATMTYAARNQTYQREGPQGAYRTPQQRGAYNMSAGNNSYNQQATHQNVAQQGSYYIPKN